ncbi:MAG: hypothetical protein AAF842_05295 [Planctomycetota bacterium]
MPSERPSLLDLHHAAGDASLGQTLLRLARLAAASDAAAPTPPAFVPRTHGRVRGQRFLAAPGGSVRTESNR